MEYCDFKVFTRVLWQIVTKFAPLNVYSGLPCVNRGNTPESGWIHLKVGMQCVLFLGLDESILHKINYGVLPKGFPYLSAFRKKEHNEVKGTSLPSIGYYHHQQGLGFSIPQQGQQGQWY